MFTVDMLANTIENLVTESESLLTICVNKNGYCYVVEETALLT